MNRVDYLHARIGQLRHRQLPHSWAAYLARLEQGEQPRGQIPMRRIEPRRLFEMVRADLRRGARCIQWRSSMPMEPVLGRVLATTLRILATDRSDSMRTITDGVTVLTAANVDAVAPVFGFYANLLKTKAPQKGRGFEYWLLRYPEELVSAREQLLPYADRQGIAGFSSYDG